MEEIFHPSSKFTLSYYSSSKLKLGETNGELIDAVYDSFYQSMTVTGAAGLAVETKDPNGNVIGSGVTDSSGSVVYEIDEGMLLGGTVISTSSLNSNVVEHSLVASLQVGSTTEGGSTRIALSFSSGFVQPSVTSALPSDMQGQLLFKHHNEVFEVDLSTFAGKDATGAYIYPDWVALPEGEILKGSVRVKNLNHPLHILVEQADYTYKFFDDGVSELSYRLNENMWWADARLKQIPSYLPSTIKKLDSMFLGYDNQLFADGVADNLALWNTSNITSMRYTFSRITGSALSIDLPIGLWDVSNVNNMENMLESNIFTNDISPWNVRQVGNMDRLLRDTWLFNVDLSKWCVPLILSEPVDFSVNSMLAPEHKPVWGTCPAS